MDAQFVRLTIASGVLKDEKFLATCLNENTPDRQVIYEDPKPGFCICAHVNRDAREVNTHDHGTSWPIYGQAFGETELIIRRGGRLLTPPCDEGTNDASLARHFPLRVPESAVRDRLLIASLF